jgi:hypothetical protein
LAGCFSDDTDEARRPEPQQPEIEDHDEDGDDEDDHADDGNMEMEPEEETDSIVPNYEGFKAHVLCLNPEMDRRNKWLVNRIAHQQEIRYKNLLDLRVAHSSYSPE